jgi:ribosomal protein S3AE
MWWYPMNQDLLQEAQSKFDEFEEMVNNIDAFFTKSIQESLDNDLRDQATQIYVMQKYVLNCIRIAQMARTAAESLRAILSIR